MGSILAFWYLKIKSKLKSFFFFRIWENPSYLELHHYLKQSFLNRNKVIENSYQRIEILKQLIKSETINYQNKKDNTPLHCAIIYYDAIAIEQLLEQKQINVNLFNNEGLNPLMLATNHHLFLAQKFSTKQITLLENLINKTNFNDFYHERKIHYLLKILDQLIYQLEEKSEPIYSLIHLVLSKIEFKIENEQITFPKLKLKNKKLKPILTYSPKVIELCKIYLEKKELENKILAFSSFVYEWDSLNKSINTNNTSALKIENDITLKKLSKERKKI
jgi:hypothetical protein